MDQKALGIFIKHHRRELGFTQQEFAERFGLSLRALRTLEQGEGTILLASAIAILNALGFDLGPAEIQYKKMEDSPEKIHDASEVLATLEKHMPILHQRFGVEKIGIFGSTARNEQDESSDIDLFIVFKEKSTLKREALLYEYLKRILHTNKIDLVTKDRVDEALFDAIHKEIRYA